MHELDDSALLRQYVERGSEEAFAALVARHVNKVYSVALRHARNPHQAEEITQAVFVILTKKAPGLSRKVVLSGWLYQTARLTAMTLIRGEIRRARREQEACMQSSLDQTHSEIWPKIEPLLDAAMARLSERDRHAVVLRYFDGKSMREVGAELGASEDAAKTRVNRAVEKLRRFFAKRGILLPAAVLTAAISANSVQAAPAALAGTAATLALAKGASFSASTLTLIKGALKLMAWTKAKTVEAVGAAVLLAGGTTTVVATRVIPRFLGPSVDESYWQFDRFSSAPPVLIIRPSKPGTPTSRMISTAGSPLHGKALALNVDLRRLLSMAYGAPETRMTFPDSLPTDRFDLMLTLPNHPEETLQIELRKRFGLAAHVENRDAEVFDLRMANRGAPGLVRGGGGNGQAASSTFISMSATGGVLSSPANLAAGMRNGKVVAFSGGNPPPGAATKIRVANNAFVAGPNGAQGGNLPPQGGAQIMSAATSDSGHRTAMKNQTLGEFAKSLENMLGRQVIDQTGTEDRFDISLQIQPQPGESSEEAIKRCVLEQLGLELVPTQESVETWVVQRSL